jgi:hypothetical protein
VLASLVIYIEQPIFTNISLFGHITLSIMIVNITTFYITILSMTTFSITIKCDTQLTNGVL